MGVKNYVEVEVVTLVASCGGGLGEPKQKCDNINLMDIPSAIDPLGNHTVTRLGAGPLWWYVTMPM